MKKAYLLILTTLTLLLAACGPKEDPVVEVSGVSLSQSTLSIRKGGTADLTATVSPSNATDKTVTWSSSNSSVATVNRGTVNAVAVGTATITATASGRTATCEVTVTPKGVSSITLDKTTASLDAKDVLTLTATIAPDDADDKTITWTSSDESVATVENGKVTAVGKGKAIITATAGSIKATCLITVSFPIKSISLNKSSVKIEEEGETTLTAKVDTDDPDVKVEWTSSDTDIATVDENGVINGIAIGETTITATAGDKTATCKVTVTEAAYKAKEKAALIKLFNANNGNNWDDFTKQNWCSDQPLELWRGIEMTPDGKHVRSVWIYDDNLKGQIPKEIADLTELEVFKMINPSGIPNEGYPLPSEIGNLKKLKNLTLWTYTVSGTVPKSIYKIQSLEALVLVHIPLSSWTIPSDIFNLKNLKQLSLRGCNLTGKIPDGIGQITGLEELNLQSNKLSGSIPASLGSLINLKELDLSINNLSGSIPTTVANMDNYWRLWPNIFWGNNFTMDNLRESKIPIPRSPKITTLSGKELDIETEFSKNQYTVLFNMNPKSGDAVDCLAQLATLYKTGKSKGLGIISYFDNNSTEISSRDERDELFKSVLNKTGATWDSFIRHLYDEYPAGAPFYAEKGSAMYPHPIENCIVIIGPDQTVVYTTLFDKSRDYLNNAVAFLQKELKTTVTHYESTSYTQDGKYTQLQKATKGKGVDLVITGDGFSDRLISNGTFKKTAEQAVEDLFSAEPLKSMKDRFNIYLVNAVSKHEEFFNGNSTVFECVFGKGSAVGGDIEKALEYAKKAVKDNARIDNVAVLVLLNTVRSGGMCSMIYPEDQSVYAGGPSVSWIPYKDVNVSGGISSLAETIVHEVGGHGIGKLGDEYAYRDQGMISAEDVSYARKDQTQRNWYLNVDFTSNPSQVLWKEFIGDSAFSSEKIGVYEGGFTFWSGVWRPTEQSVMNDGYHNPNFNAPSRALIWKRIMKLSEGESWNYDYNAFKTWDKAHPVQTRVTTRSSVERPDFKEVHLPPVVIRKTWKEVTEGR